MQKYNYKYGTIYHADVLAAAQHIETESVDCVITSPPYWQLRDYGYPEQWGLEPTYQEYLAHLQQLMKELWRIVKPTGTVWVNLGDSYGSFRGKSGTKPDKFEREQGKVENNKHVTDRPSNIRSQFDKCQMVIPHRFAIDCIENGWILRNDIIWAKPNGMPESVTDRFSKKKEYVFFFVKQPKYYFDLSSVREKHKKTSGWAKQREKGINTWNNATQTKIKGQLGGKETGDHPLGKNCGDVSRFWQGQNISLEDFLELATAFYYNEISDLWEIATKPSSSEHYASYNLDLIKKPILAGCPVGGLIYDPFMGSGMTAIAGMKYGRRFIGSEASGKYIKISDSNILEYEKDLFYKSQQNGLFIAQ